MKFICKTPLRVSFFGGGTDYPEYLEEYKGGVLGTTIDQYVYIFALPMPSVAEKPFKLCYRLAEEVNHPTEFQHPVVREVLVDMDWKEPLNIATMSDLPGGSGLGSSSVFTVGLLNVLYHLKNQQITRYDLAQAAIRVEQILLKENVGCQDQIHAAFGGLNMYHFSKNCINIQPVRIHTNVREYLNDHMVLVYTGITRHATKILDEQIKATKERRLVKELSHLLKLAEEGMQVLEGSDPQIVVETLGKMLTDAWLTKRALTSSLTNSFIDEVYTKGMELGAYGGKLCGAGGGGFFFFLTPPKSIERFCEVFGRNSVVKISMVDHGSQVGTSL